LAAYTKSVSTRLNVKVSLESLSKIASCFKLIMETKYKVSIKVCEIHIDEFKHVNNEIYLTWLLKAATKHSAVLGYSLQKYVDDGAAFVVRRHELDYLAPAFLEDELVVETWIAEMSGFRTTRGYRIVRKHDQKIILQAKTFWVYVSLSSGRPLKIPKELIGVFNRLSCDLNQDVNHRVEQTIERTLEQVHV